MINIKFLFSVAFSIFLYLSVAPPEASPNMYEVPAGTLLSVELVDPIHTSKNKTGDSFRGRINEGVWVRGAVVIPPGSTVRGGLTEVVASGRVKGQAKLQMTLQSLEIDGKSYPLYTDTLSYTGEPHTSKNWGSWLTGALQGALYGVLFGGQEGAIIGAGAGAAVGGASGVIKGKQDIHFTQGAKLMFETSRSLSLPVFSAPGAIQDMEQKTIPEKPGTKPAS